MARLPRLNIPDIPQHVVQRGNNRQACFLTRRDRVVYLKKLKEYAKQYSVAIHAFVLMTNHVHLLVTPKTGDGVSHLMQALGRYYVRYFNKAHKRTGTLWEGRFKSCLVDSENYFLVVSRYIELNPVRAKMVKQPSEYTWSSYHHNADGKRIKLITEHPVYLSLANNIKTRNVRYKGLFESVISEERVKEIRCALGRSWVLGSEKFKLELENESGLEIVLNRWGGVRKTG